MTEEQKEELTDIDFDWVYCRDYMFESVDKFISQAKQEERDRIIEELGKFISIWYLEMEFEEIKKIINNTKDKPKQKECV